MSSEIKPLSEISRKQLSAKLEAYKQIKEICGIQKATPAGNTTAPDITQNNEMSAHAPTDSGDHMIMVEGGGGFFDDDEYSDPVFWGGAWAPDFIDAAEYASSSYLASPAPTPQICTDKCRIKVDDASDGINLVCAGIGLINPVVGFSCAVGSYIGKQAGRYVCDHNCGP